MSVSGGEQRTLAGRYELAEIIGRGGMGTVYRAVDLVLGRSVAVKTLPWLVADENPSAVARFEREARAAAALSHPAVVGVYDTGADGSTHFIVMELVAGRSLDAILRDQGPFDPDRAAAIAGRVADALAAAHRAGIVHRDIKPANVMVAEDGSVKVLDFGIARAIGASALTNSSSVIGTAAYMAPEQAEGKTADERSDIYALGCVLYALLLGHPPFSGDGAAAVMHQHAKVEPRPPRAESPRIPSALSVLVMRMLAKSPDDRPQSAGEVRDRLAGIADLAEPRAGGPAVASAGAGGPPAGATRPDQGTARPGRRGMIVAGALVAAILVAVIVALTSGSGTPHRLAAARHGSTLSTPTAVQAPSPTGKAAAKKRTGAKGAKAGAKSAGAKGAPAKAAPKAAGPAAGAATPASGAGGRMSTLFSAARAVVSLAAADGRTGAIDPQAGRQLTAGFSTVLRAWQTGGAAAAQQQLATVRQQVGTLEQQGNITSAAAPGLNRALTNLSSALATVAARQKGHHPALGRGGLPGLGAFLQGQGQGQGAGHGQGQGQGQGQRFRRHHPGH